MKCPECSHNQLRGKGGMVCRKCGYKFLFDPKKTTSGYKMTDGRFKAVLAKVSRKGTNYFTEDELYHVAALKNIKKGGCIVATLISAVVLGFLVFGAFSFLDLVLRLSLYFLILTSIVAFGVFSSRRILPRKSWDEMVRKWVQQNSGISGLIREPGLYQPPAAQAEPDIHDYGASRLIVCQHDIQVDWLVLNGFHSANAAVVISESGYPGYIAVKADELLQNNPDLNVLLIHDAGREGEAMKSRVLNDWPVKETQITDLGITNEMLDRFGINKMVRKSFGEAFPLHAIPYHVLDTLLSKSVADGGGGDFCFVWETTYGEDGDLGGDGDFG